MIKKHKHIVQSLKKINVVGTSFTYQPLFTDSAIFRRCLTCKECNQFITTFYSSKCHDLHRAVSQYIVRSILHLLSSKIDDVLPQDSVGSKTGIKIKDKAIKK